MADGRWWSRERLRWATLVLAGVFGVIAAAWYAGVLLPNSDGRERRTPPTWLVDDHWSSGPSPAASFAPVGDGVLAVGGSRDAPQLRRPGGTWVELSHLPVRGSYTVMPLGDTALVYGHRCGPLDCDGGDFIAFLLDAERSSWTPVDWPEPTLIDSEVELWPMGSSPRHAVLSIAGSSFTVDDAGVARKLPRSAFGCVTSDDRLLSTEFRDVGEYVTEVGGLRGRPLEDPDADWTSRAAPPPGFPVQRGEMRCDPHGLSYPIANGEELVYSDTDDTWTVAPSELTRLLGRPASDVPGLWSRSPSGELQAYVGAGDVVVRRGNGPWESTGAEAWSVVATNDAVYTLGPDDPDLVRIWPTS